MVCGAGACFGGGGGLGKRPSLTLNGSGRRGGGGGGPGRPGVLGGFGNGWTIPLFVGGGGGGGGRRDATLTVQL
ncbi:hypothetical protein OIU84_027451, partial [Salix udensis]